MEEQLSAFLADRCQKGGEIGLRQAYLVFLSQLLPRDIGKVSKDWFRKQILERGYMILTSQNRQTILGLCLRSSVVAR